MIRLGTLQAIGELIALGEQEGFGITFNPLPGGAEDQIADVVAYEPGVHRRSTNLRCWYRAGFTTL